MNLHDYYFELPEHLIAQTPLADRPASRLLVMNRATGVIEHRSFYNIIDYLNEGDCLVLNNTRVIPARLYGQTKNGGKVELLLLKRLPGGNWEALAKPGRKVRTGDVLSFGDGRLVGTVMDVTADGNRIVRFEHEGTFEAVLASLGEMPLPPYIKTRLSDKERYQTVYAKVEGSAAAPTAGLHFTEELLADIKAKGVRVANITLHVGLGTFRPVKTENILEHKMHSETYSVDESQAEIINEAKRNGGRVIAVGTTSCRTLEATADGDGFVRPGEGATDIFIYPGYKFKAVDGLITNFHLPESTLIMLVSAFSTREFVLGAYREAVGMGYRFFSFGDCMALM